MGSKREFIERWMQAEGAKKASPAKKRSITIDAEGESAPESAHVEPPTALVPFADMDVWYLSADMIWTVPGRGTSIIVPRGFATDFASVPQYFWTWMPPTGRYGLPAIVHDWLYWDQTLLRQQADDIFDGALAELGVSGWRRFVLYRSVRWFGAKYWRENTEAKGNGEGRVLRLFPDDRRTTWTEWRRHPGVFV